jgi:hypothetical protein
MRGKVTEVVKTAEGAALRAERSGPIKDNAPSSVGREGELSDTWAFSTPGATLK